MNVDVKVNVNVNANVFASANADVNANVNVNVDVNVSVDANVHVNFMKLNRNVRSGLVISCHAMPRRTDRLRVTTVYIYGFSSEQIAVSHSS